MTAARSCKVKKTRGDRADFISSLAVQLLPQSYDGAAEIIVSADGRHAPNPLASDCQAQQKRIADEEDVCGRFAYASVRMTGKANASPAAVFNSIATLSLDPTTGAW